MNVSRPADALGIGRSAEIFRVLTQTSKPLSGRQIAALVSGGSERSIQTMLGHLAEQGILDAQDVPPARLYTLNHEHLAYQAVVEITGIRAGLFQKLRETISAWTTTPAHASVFGSTARGDGNQASDVDLLLIRPEHVTPHWEDDRRRLEEAIPRWTGNRAQIVDLSCARFGRAVSDQLPVVGSVLADGVLIAGQPLRTLMDQHRETSTA